MDESAEFFVSGSLTGKAISTVNTLRQPCPAPAPLVVNGLPYVGCRLEKGHEGQHKVTIRWEG